MRVPSKEIAEFKDEVNQHCRLVGRRIAWEFGGSHIKVRDSASMRSIVDADGVPLTLPTTPSDYRWKANARAQFRRAGLLPRIVRRAEPVNKTKRALSLPDRIGRSLRSDLSPATRRALLKEISQLLVEAGYANPQHSSDRLSA